MYSLQKWKQPHHFNIDAGHGEKNTRRVILLTVATMILEISAGLAFGSMALLADGWHMGTHAVALGITAFAFRFARRNADNPRYSFGTGKVGVLGGFTSAIVLAVVSILMAAESLQRLYEPTPIRFNEAIAVAVLGLIVNIISALLLKDHPHPSSGPLSDNLHPQDHNLKAAYFHVLADALTSVLAIIALVTGKGFGWIWMDPVMGLVGAVIITRWAYGLLRDTSKILLDRDVNKKIITAICATIESDSDNQVSDFHIWRIGSHQLSVIISIITRYPKPPGHYKNLLAEFNEIAHVTIELNPIHVE